MYSYSFGLETKARLWSTEHVQTKHKEYFKIETSGVEKHFLNTLQCKIYHFMYVYNNCIYLDAWFSKV